MKYKSILGLSFIFALTVVLFLAQPVSAQNLQYAPRLYPNAFSTPKLHWRITNVTSEVVEFGFGSGAFWKAQAGQPVTFEIQEIANDELFGLFTIGNLTMLANNTRIAGELAFSIWPWFPGLVSQRDWATVDQDAINAASSYFLNGTLDITTTSTTKTYVYHQGPFGNQNTTLVYDISSGVLLSAYTEVFFLSDYHLGIEFIIQTQNPTSLTIILFVGILAIALVVVSIGYIILRFQKMKEMILLAKNKGELKSPKGAVAIRVALVAIFAALAIGGNYTLSAIPNIELSSLMVFLSGFLFGPPIGALVAVIAMTIYQIWNPWGAFIPPIGLAVIGCTIFIGMIGGILGKALQRFDYSDIWWFLLPALFGILLTFFFDLISNFTYSMTFGVPFIVTLITGLPFTAVHVTSNALLFGLITQPVTRAVQHLQLKQFQLQQHTIKNTRKNKAHEPRGV